MKDFSKYHETHLTKCIIVPNILFTIPYTGEQTRICYWFPESYREDKL